jgi:hypothetical protein
MNANWFETIQSLALFYQKMAVAMGAAVATGMMPFSRPPVKNSVRNEAALPRIGAQPAPSRKRQKAVRKSSKGTRRKSSKRAHSRRKAA